MKILHVVNSLQMGGAEKMVHDLSIAQKKDGLEVNVLMLNDSKNYLVTNLIQAHVNVICLSKKIGLYNPLLILLLIPYIRKYDLIHVHLFPAQYWVGFAKLLSFSKTVLITTEHSTNNRRMNHVILKHVDRFVYKYCYKYIVSCAEKVKAVMEIKYPKANHVTISNGVDVMKYKNAISYTKQELGLTDKSYILCMVARFAYPKQQDTIVRALALLPSEFHALFVGGGDVEAVKKVVEELSLNGRVHFLGVRNDVHRILKSADVVLMSSVYEGLSLSSIEGMAVVKPFVASNVDGLRDVVEGAGLLFKCGDEKDLANVILRLYNDKSMYQTIALSCFERAKEYDLNTMVNKYYEVYKNSLNE